MLGRFIDSFYTIENMNSITKRLLPLITLNFFTGLMFHYAIAFPFFSGLGFSTNQLVAYSAFVCIIVMFFEIPFGILADRWSRKWMLLGGLIFMIIGVIVMGSANSFNGIMAGAAISAIYFATRSGITEAITYDVLLEMQQRDSYEKYIGLIKGVHTVGLVFSSIAGAIIASAYNYSAAYYISAICGALAFIAFLSFKEPQLHRAVEAMRIVEHTKVLFKALNEHTEIRMLVFISFIIGILFNFMMEIDPLWPIALGLATVWFGPLNALLLSSQGFAGAIVYFIVNRTRRIKFVAVVMLLAALGLLISNIWIIVLSQFLLATSATSLMIIMSGRIHDTLPSSQRSGAESAVSTMATLGFILSLPLFSFLAGRFSVFTAAWVLVFIAIIGVVSILLMKPARVTGG